MWKTNERATSSFWKALHHSHHCRHQPQSNIHVHNNFLKSPLHQHLDGGSWSTWEVVLQRTWISGDWFSPHSHFSNGSWWVHFPTGHNIVTKTKYTFSAQSYQRKALKLWWSFSLLLSYDLLMKLHVICFAGMEQKVLCTVANNAIQFIIPTLPLELFRSSLREDRKAMLEENCLPSGNVFKLEVFRVFYWGVCWLEPCFSHK